jgi:hypothetical protein
VRVWSGCLGAGAGAGAGAGSGQRLEAQRLRIVGIGPARRQHLALGVALRAQQGAAALRLRRFASVA